MNLLQSVIMQVPVVALVLLIINSLLGGWRMVAAEQILTDLTCVSEIDAGLGIGLQQTTQNGKRICSYLGIPYARPPINELRFESPKPINWTGVGNFVEMPDKCAQMISHVGTVEGDEDCLYLSIFAPLRNVNDTLLPVFFWIHGGSFWRGSSDSDHNGFDYIVEQDVIVVAINYRLGPFGFLYLPSLNITGNMGLKDQQVALEWVQNNIKNFGGDPKQVTIVGWSAGAASVTYHMYNEHSVNLFQRAIAMSGSMLAPWAYLEPSSWCARNYLDVIGIHTKQGLMTASFETLLPPGYRKSVMFSYFYYWHFCTIPTVEPTWVDDRFMEKCPSKSVYTPLTNASLLIGYTNLEVAPMLGTVKYFMSNQNFANSDEDVNDKISDYLQNFTDEYFNDKFTSDLEAIYLANITSKERVQQLKSVDKEKEYEKELFLTSLCSVADTIYAVQEFMDIYSKVSGADVYGYQFSFQGKFGHFRKESHARWKNEKGAVHGDDLGYLFVPYAEDYSYDADKIEEEFLISQKMVKMWTNFVKTGNPTPTTDNYIVTKKWAPYHEKMEIMNINNTSEMIRPRQSIAYRLWDKIYKCLHKCKCNFLDTNI